MAYAQEKDFQKRPNVSKAGADQRSYPTNGERREFKEVKKQNSVVHGGRKKLLKLLNLFLNLLKKDY